MTNKRFTFNTNLNNNASKENNIERLKLNKQPAVSTWKQTEK